MDDGTDLKKDDKRFVIDTLGFAMGDHSPIKKDVTAWVNLRDRYFEAIEKGSRAIELLELRDYLRSVRDW